MIGGCCSEDDSAIYRLSTIKSFIPASLCLLLALMSIQPSIDTQENFDCVVIGNGHAGSCAAYSAAQHGCKSKRVLIIDKAPKEWAGGNGYFTAGAHRTVHAGLEDILPIVSNVSQEQADNIDITAYTASDFTDDINRLSNCKSDKALVNALVESSWDAIQWLKKDIGVDFILSFNRQAYEIEGRQRFWGGMVLSVRDGGKGLIASHHQALKRIGVHMWFGAKAIDLTVKKGIINGVIVSRNDQEIRITCPTVVLAAGGYESDSKMRSKFLGDQWQYARVRPSLSAKDRKRTIDFCRFEELPTTQGTALNWHSL